jgi:hypothetical protein
MDRRVWGTALVAVVLVAAFVVPNLGGRRVVGIAAPIPVPDPPRVGQCLLAAASGGRSALEFNQVTVSSAGVGPCGAENFGEVVAVASDVHSFPSTVSNRTSHPEPLACQPTARRYVGWNVNADDPTFGETAVIEPGGGEPEDPSVGPARKLGPWRPVATTSIALYGPNLWQYLSGQNWLACVLLPRDAPYAGSVRGGPAGSASSAYAACWNRGGFVPREPIPCARPHSGETFGVARLDDTDMAALDGSCGDLVRSATGMSDPGRGGVIIPEVQIGSSNGATSQSDSAGQASCTISVVGDRQLTSSLTGIGDGPLPWA